MDCIRQRFLQAEEDFLSATQLGVQALTDFADRWQALQSDWESCFNETDDDTQRLANGVAAKIETLAGDFFTFESRTLSLEDGLLNSIEDALASLSLEDPVDPPINLPSEGSSGVPGPPQSRHSAVSPSEWLLHNLHNPYPLPHLQFSAGHTAGSKHMKDWFSKARQRIGWTRLLRDRFAGCRTLATDAAFRALVRDDPENPLDGDLKTAFLAIRFHAELVYGENMVPPPTKTSRSVSPTPSLTFSSSSEDSEDEQHYTPAPGGTIQRPSKRAYPDILCTPSPKRRRSHDSPTTLTLQSQESCHADLPSPRSKKRRLSESDSTSPRPKRPKGMDSRRLHAVSDPVIIPAAPASFDFDTSFRIPDPASTDPLDSSLFDLDFFKPLYLSSAIPSAFGEPTPSPSKRADMGPEALSTDPDLPADFSALFEIPQLDLSHSIFPTDTDWTEFLNFGPDLSPFSTSPSPMPSFTSTPLLINDAILSPSPSSCSIPSSPQLPLDVLPHLNEKDAQLHPVGEPVIYGQDFLFPPYDNAGISCATILLSTH